MARDKGGSLRKWSQDSYDVKTGRSASSLEEAGSGSRGNHTTDVQTQIGAAEGKGVNGAPGVSAMNKSGSADPGRRKWGGSDLP